MSEGINTFELQTEIREWAIQKGWYEPDQPPRDPLSLLMLAVTELAEAAETFRIGNPPCQRPGMEHLSHAEEEMADAIIRLFQMADEFGFDLHAAIRLKMDFNWTRPRKHGKQR